jgi:hypothetical protein
VTTCFYSSGSSSGHFFKRQYLNKKVIPKYANVKIAHISPAASLTLTKVQTIRIKGEVKFQYKKKEKLISDLHNIHLQAALKWGSSWYLILDPLHESFIQELEKKV